MKQVEIQKRLRFRITKNGFLLDEQEGEFSEKILPDTGLGFNVQTCCGSFVWNWCQI